MPAPKLPRLLRAGILLRDDATCTFCRRRRSAKVRMTVDHLTPRVWGGTDDVTNLAACCKACNSLKGAMTATAYAFLLKEQGYLPTRRALLARVEAAIARPIDWEAAREYARSLRRSPP